ncbi:class I SAM-dependent methyltransferase [Antrihabitans spumae]|uniref:Class I SAM-dependent methyltransferase n=1 Tax=Antrihabitans spumae TaxID=3373370 RepID=A0ABW7K766_9NOCA
MGMNVLHRMACRSAAWEVLTTRKLVPWALCDLDLGESTVEIGPGYGANLRALRLRTGSLTGVELDETMAKRLQALHSDQVTVIHGDAAKMPLGDASYTSVVTFSMLHHVPSEEQQDAVFAQARRVLRPGGVFAGMDGLHSTAFRLLHTGDTYLPIAPEALPSRLFAAGFDDVAVETYGPMFRFHARVAA